MWAHFRGIFVRKCPDWNVAARAFTRSHASNPCDSLAKSAAAVIVSRKGRGEEFRLEVRIADHAPGDAIVKAKEQATCT